MQTQCYLYSNSAQQQSSETHKQHFVMLVSYSRRRKEVCVIIKATSVGGEWTRSDLSFIWALKSVTVWSEMMNDPTNQVRGRSHSYSSFTFQIS